jgi:hypothetical protein
MLQHLTFSQLFASSPDTAEQALLSKAVNGRRSNHEFHRTSLQRDLYRTRRSFGVCRLKVRTLQQTAEPFRQSVMAVRIGPA